MLRFDVAFQFHLRVRCVLDIPSEISYNPVIRANQSVSAHLPEVVLFYFNIWNMKFIYHKMVVSFRDIVPREIINCQHLSTGEDRK